MRRATVSLTALILTVAACGDDNSILDGSSTTAAPTATSGDGVAATTTAAPTATTQPATPPPGGSSDAVQAAFDNYETSALRVVYRMGQGGDEQILTISRDPNIDPPVSATLIGLDGEEGRFITIGDRTIICGPPGEECIEFPSELNMGESLLGPLVSGFLLNDTVATSPGFSVEESTTTIAGRSGLCFTFTPSGFVTDADVTFVRQCVDSEIGFVLLVEYLETGGGAVETVMELLEYGLPTPADFELSGPVTTMPGG